MVVAIGLIVAAYAMARLILALRTPEPGRPPAWWQFVPIVGSMLLIALLSLDLVLGAATAAARLSLP